jgi:serine/threonine protein kinase
VKQLAKCPKCGATLSADGRCLKCLLEIALEPELEAGDLGDETVPAIDSLAAEGPDTRLGRYKLLHKLGEGGFGIVYMAEQEEPIRRRVALKILRPGTETKEVIARFEAERQALALMDHPNIAKVFDAGSTADGRPFFVMELVEGIKITEYCDLHEFSIRQRLDLFVQVCQAVQHAHQKGIIHRDIKPSNVLVCESDGQAAPKVIDFGIA